MPPIAWPLFALAFLTAIVGVTAHLVAAAEDRAEERSMATAPLSQISKPPDEAP